MLISVEGKGENQLEPVQENMGSLQFRHTAVCLKKNLTKPSCLKERPTVDSPFFGIFPSDRIPTATNDVNVHFFIHSSNSCKLYQRIPGTF